MMRWLALVVMVGCTFSVPRKPDVLLVVLEGVRADRLAVHGADRATSNQLKAMADAGVAFHDATSSAGWSWPGHAALFTGEPPWVHGAHWGDSTAAAQPNETLSVTAMRPELPTLAERFREAGYRTVVLGSNPMLASEYGLTRGFAQVESADRDDGVVAAAEVLLGEPDPRPLLMVVTLSAAQGPLQLTPSAPWSNKHRRMLHRTHAPDWVKRHRVDAIPPALDLVTRTAPGRRTGEESFARDTLKLSEFDLEFIRDLYDGELVNLDRSLGELVAAWNRSERGSGILAVTSTSGTMLGEGGVLGDGVRLTATSNRVPLVIAAPGRLDAGVDVYTPVQMRELHPTLLDLAGVVENPSGSLVPVVGGQARTEAIQAAVWTNPDYAVRVGGRFASGQHLYREGGEFVVQEGDTRPAMATIDGGVTTTSDGLVERAVSAFTEGKSGALLGIPNPAAARRSAMDSSLP